MKSSAIYLSTDDDRLSIQDKLNQCSTPRALLIWSNPEAPILRELDLKILQRHCKHLGIQLGAVCNNPDLKILLRELGVYFFDSVADSQKYNWRRTRMASRKLPTFHVKTRELIYPLLKDHIKKSLFVEYISIILSCLACIVVLAQFIPSASVVIIPKPVIRSVEFSILISDQVKSVSVNGWVPLKFESGEIEVQNEVVSSGSIKIPIKKAVGFVILKNASSTLIRLPDTTILLNSSGKSYALLSSIDIPPGETRTTRIGAIEAGSASNTTSNDHFTILGDFGESIRVTNQDPISGGTDQEVVAPTNADYLRIKNLVLSLVDKQVSEKLNTPQNTNDVYVPGTLAYLESGFESYVPKVGEPGANLKLIMNKRYLAAYISRKDIIYIANALMSIDLPNKWMILPETAQIEFMGRPTTNEKGIITWPVKVQMEAIPQINVQDVELSLAGNTMVDARFKLLSLMPDATVQVNVNPAWIHFLPFYPFQIKVVNGNTDTNISN